MLGLYVLSANTGLLQLLSYVPSVCLLPSRFNPQTLKPSNLVQMTENPPGIVDLLGSSIPQQATFFITYIALSGFVGYGLALSQIIRVAIYLIKKKFLAKTEEELREAWAPGSFNYGATVPKDLLIVLLGL